MTVKGVSRIGTASFIALSAAGLRNDPCTTIDSTFWTSSDFAPWPGFTPMIYRDCSVPFLGGDYKVLRGGSWAVAPSTIRPSFRNWDYPVRRQIFTGVRMAWDA